MNHAVEIHKNLNRQNSVFHPVQSEISNTKLSPHPPNAKASAKEDDVQEEVVEKPQSLQKDLKVKKTDEEEKTKSAPDEKINSAKSEEKKKKKAVKKSSTHQKNGMQIFAVNQNTLKITQGYFNLDSKHVFPRYFLKLSDFSIKRSSKIRSELCSRI